MKYLKLFLITLFFSGCSSVDKPGFDYLELKTTEVAEKLSAGKVSIKEMYREKAAGDSYFYILNIDGRIEYHPQKALTGNDFSRFGFISRIIKEKNGCIRVTTGSVSRIIIFRDSGNNRILCLTTRAEGMAGSDKCKIYKKEETK